MKYRRLTWGWCCTPLKHTSGMCNSFQFCVMNSQHEMQPPSLQSISIVDTLSETFVKQPTCVTRSICNSLVGGWRNRVSGVGSSFLVQDGVHGDEERERDGYEPGLDSPPPVSLSVHVCRLPRLLFSHHAGGVCGRASLRGDRSPSL